MCDETHLNENHSIESIPHFQPSITSPRAVGTGISPKKTPKHAIKYLLKSPAFKKEILEARGGETPEKEK